MNATTSRGPRSGGDASRDPEKQPPTPAEVTRQLERILAHPLFQTSQRLSSFLRFTVEGVLAGRREHLKEYVIGVEVFGRPSSYNPQEEPVVRIMAGRLRGKLAEYYQGGGQSDPILIELPRGGYVPRFSWRQQPTASMSSRPAAAPQSQSVGREDELGRLHAAFAAAAAGAGAILTVSGDAGMGKTTIAEDFLAQIEVRNPDIWVARGRCSERLADTDAFVPILDSLDGLLRGGAADQVAGVMLSSAPAWYLQVAHLTGEQAETLRKQVSGTSSERMRREFLAFFEQLSGGRPVVWFLDDLHWADPSTCDLLAYLGARVRNLRILILMTYRAAEIAAQRRPFFSLKIELERHGVSRDLPLAFLRVEDVERYLAMQFPTSRFPEEFPRAVHERTEGNPLFMTDLLRFLRERGILVEDGGSWRLDRPLDEVRRLIPTGIDNMIRLKVEQFSEEDRRILLCGTVQGIQFDSAVAARVLSRDPAEVEERLQELDVAHHFVRAEGEQEFPNHTFSVRYRFVHVFYQHVLYASLAPSRRAAHSLAIARAMVECYGGDTSSATAADLALLFEAGRDYANASQYFLHAARNAARVFAYPECGALCERGLRALASLPESGERDAHELKLSLTLGMAWMVTRGYAAPEVEATHRRSRELCLKLKDYRRLMGVLWGLHTCDVNGGALPRSLEVAREMRRLAEASADPIAVVESLHALGTTLAFMGRLREAREALEQIFAAYPVERHRLHGSLYAMDPCVTSLSMLARLLAFLGHLDQAAAKAAVSVDLANRLVHPPSLAYAIFWVGWVHHARGEYEESCRHLEAAMSLSREHALPLILEWGRIVRGSALAKRGRVAEGISEIRKSIGRQDAMRSQLERPYCLTLLAEALAGAGAGDEARALCDQALEIGRRTEDRCYEAETHRIRGESLLCLGGDARLSEAESELERALGLAREQQCRLLELRAAVSSCRLRCRLGDAAGGRRVLAETAGWFTEGSHSPAVSSALDLLRE